MHSSCLSSLCPYALCALDHTSLCPRQVAKFHLAQLTNSKVVMQVKLALCQLAASTDKEQNIATARKAIQACCIALAYPSIFQLKALADAHFWSSNQQAQEHGTA